MTNITSSDPYTPISFTGAITLTNDMGKWGPWAGKILTGEATSGQIYAIDTNGMATNYTIAGGIAADSFALIPTNEDLYFIEAGNSTLLKISRTALAPYVGDLVVSQTALSQPEPGVPVYVPLATIFIIAWDPTNAVFISHSIPAPDYSSVYEDLTFAPIDLPTQ